MYVYVDGQVKGHFLGQGHVKGQRSSQGQRSTLGQNVILKVKGHLLCWGHLKVKGHFKVKGQFQDKLSNGHIFRFIAIEINWISQKIDVFSIDNSIFLTKAFKVCTRSSTKDKYSNRKHRLTCCAIFLQISYSYISCSFCTRFFIFSLMNILLFPRFFLYFCIIFSVT